MSSLDNLVDEINALQERVSGPDIDFIKSEDYQKAIRSLRSLEKEYAENLPLTSLSRCPICQTVAKFPIDTERFDSPWWDDGTLHYPDIDVCEHFYLLQGSVKFDSTEIFQGRRGVVYPGPDKPFVIPRLLRETTISVVISEVRLADRFTGYPVCYFSQNPEIEVVQHQSWARKTYRVLDVDGNHIMNHAANLPWDFDLPRWHAREKIWWISPTNGSLTLERVLPPPFDVAQGRGVNQVIRSGTLSNIWLPNGEEPDPWDSHVHD